MSSTVDGDGDGSVTVTLSASDPDVIVTVLRSLVDHVVALGLVDCREPLEVYLDAVANDSVGVILRYRAIGERSIPRGPMQSVDLDDVVSLHVW